MTEHILVLAAFALTWPLGVAICIAAIRLYLRAIS